MKPLPLPITVDYDGLARGLLDLFTDEERAVLRFGMLPAVKMEILENQLRGKFMEECVVSSEGGDRYMAVVTAEGWDRHVDFSMNELVSNISHNVSLKIYEYGDLVA